jgi:membrane-associated HD superfamily phosphohydrolase
MERKNNEALDKVREKLNRSNEINEQLKQDIEALLEFKNELESLAEDQNKQIQNLNIVSNGFILGLREVFGGAQE